MEQRKMEPLETEPQEIAARPRDEELLCHEFNSKAIVTAIATLSSTETADHLSVTELLNIQPEEKAIEVALSKQGSTSPTASATSTSTSISVTLASEPLPWRPNTRPKLPPGALLDIDQGPLWDIMTEWLLLEDICHLDSALCQKSRRRRAEWLAMLSTKVLLFNREYIRILREPNQPDRHTHRALEGAAALNWVLKRGIHLASLHLPHGFFSSISRKPVDFESIREAVASLALNGRLDKLETIRFSGCNYIKDADLAAVLSKCYGSVKSIDIQDCALTESAAAHIKRCTKLEALNPKGNESAVEMAEIFQACKKLRKVDLSGFDDRLTDNVVLSVADNCNLLEHFDLRFCMEVSDAAIKKVADSCPLLQYVNLIWTNITDVAVVALCKNCPLLKRMFLDECSLLTDAAVLAVAERLPGLTHIDLGGTGAITSSAVETLASRCRELEYIVLSYKVRDFTLIKIAEHCSKLKELRVSHCRLLTDAAVLAVAERLPGLTHIDLSGIEAITSSAVETLASKCRELEYINLTWCPNVSDVTLSKIAEHCSKLKELYVYGCFYVTAVGEAEIRLKCSKLEKLDYTSIC